MGSTVPDEVRKTSLYCPKVGMDGMDGMERKACISSRSENTCMSSEAMLCEIA